MKIPASEKPGKIKSFFDNYKALVIISLVLFTFGANAQDTTHLRQALTVPYSWPSVEAVKSFTVPRDTFKLAVRDSGSYAFKNGYLYQWSAKKWNPVAKKLTDSTFQIGPDVMLISPGPGGGSDSATNSDYGILKNSVGIIRVFSFDSATVFTQLRATIPAGVSSNNSVGSSGFSVAITGTNNVKKLVGASGIILDSLTTNQVKIVSDTAFLSTNWLPNHPASLKTPNTNFKLAVPNTDSIKVVSFPANAGILGDSGTAKTLTIKADTSVLSTVAKVRDSTASAKALANTKNSGVRISGANVYDSVNGVERFKGTVTATAALDPWYTIAEADTIIVDPFTHGPLQKVDLTANRAIKFANLREGTRLTLKFIHDAAGTSITNLIGNTDLPADFYFVGAAGWATQIKGIYDFTAEKWNWTFSVAPDVAGLSFYSTHMMLAFTDLAIPGQRVWLQNLKDGGLNHIWGHMDLYDSVGGNSYRVRLKHLLDTAYIVGGLPVMPGMSGPMTAKEMKQVVLDTYTHPNIYKVNGKPTYAIYDFDSTKLVKMVDSLTNHGILKSQYNILVSTFGYPQYQYWLTPARWVNHVGTPDDSASVAQVYVFNPLVDGLINFSVDKATSYDSLAKNRIRNENLWIEQASNALGKTTYSGYTNFYMNTAVQVWDQGFSGLDSIVKDIINLPVAKRPLIMGSSTNNDYVELSYTWPGINPDTSGLFYMPRLNQGFYFNTISYPLLDHSGVEKFLKPYREAFKNRRQTITITTDAIFAMHPLHSRSATASSVIPAALVPYRYSDSSFITQSTWNGSRAAVTPSWVGAGKLPNFDKIRVAVWLIAPAQIRINSTTSAMLSAGIHFFEVPLALGTPSYDIIRGGVSVAHGVSPQAITTSTWPGQHNYLIYQAY